RRRMLCRAAVAYRSTWLFSWARSLRRPCQAHRACEGLAFATLRLRGHLHDHAETVTTPRAARDRPEGPPVRAPHDSRSAYRAIVLARQTRRAGVLPRGLEPGLRRSARAVQRARLGVA